MIAARAELDGVRRQLGREMNTILTGLRNEVETARTHEMELNDRLRTARDEMVRMDKAEVSVGQLSRQLGANRNLYESLLKRYTETVALRDNQQPEARVISRAQIPLSPAYPKATQKIGRAHVGRSEEHTSELQSLMRISYAVFCSTKKKKTTH